LDKERWHGAIEVGELDKDEERWRGWDGENEVYTYTFVYIRWEDVQSSGYRCKVASTNLEAIVTLG
jgi:hypothetical protein